MVNVLVLASYGWGGANDKELLSASLG
jgi:hypothetical protein